MLYEYSEHIIDIIHTFRMKIKYSYIMIH